MTRAEGLRVWHAAQEFSDDIAELCEQMPRRGTTRLRAQMLDSSESVADNIAEAAGRGVPGEKLQFLRYARASLEECQGQLKRCRKRGLVDEDTFHRLWNRSVAINKMLGSLIARIERALEEEKDSAPKGLAAHDPGEKARAPP